MVKSKNYYKCKLCNRLRACSLNHYTKVQTSDFIKIKVDYLKKYYNFYCTGCIKGY